MSSQPLFPGGVAVSDLVAYDWESADGRCGGSPHLHTASSEGYVVIGGSGAVHTISRGGPEVHPLEAGSVVWFSPGTVHRLVNDGGLRLLVVMQNSGLPEAGDAVLSFPGTHPRRSGVLTRKGLPHCRRSRGAPRTSSRRRRAPAATSR